MCSMLTLMSAPIRAAHYRLQCERHVLPDFFDVAFMGPRERRWCVRESRRLCRRVQLPTWAVPLGSRFALASAVMGHA